MSKVSPLPDIGTRLVHSGYLATVRFVGPVEGTQGIWLGVEWDDPKRGKNDGVKDGHRYFSCTIPNAGSFIRPNSSVSYGVSFLQALAAKYVDLPHGSTVEKLILGSSNGAIEVEAVGLDRIRKNLSRLETLREISLDNERVSTPNTPGEIRRTCPGIRGLDLSKNLFPSWDIIALIIIELPQLKYLTLNQNRLSMPKDVSRFRSAFAAITEIQLNATLTSWPDIIRLISYMPALTAVEAGYNRITKLEVDATGSNAETCCSIHMLNMDGNELDNWAHTIHALQQFPRLERVIMSSNHIEAIEGVGTATPLTALKHLSLAANRLRSWNSVDHLRLWCPGISSLTLSGNPLTEEPELGKNARQFVVAKIPTLTTLDAAAISTKERTDCELFYLSYINKSEAGDEEERTRRHPRWPELCIKYGRPDLPSAADVSGRQDTLSNRLLQINIYQCSERPSNAAPDSSNTRSLRVLPTMSMRAFRMKVAKSFGVNRADQGSIKLSLQMSSGSYAEIDLADETHDLSWWGVENGSVVALHLAH